MLNEDGSLIRDIYRSEERKSPAKLVPSLRISPSGNLNFQMKSPVSQHVHVPVGLPLNQLNTARAQASNSNKKLLPNMTNLNVSLSTL